MDEEPSQESRFHFFSFTFLAGFGIGAFVGVALGLLAFLFVDAETSTSVVSQRNEPTPVFTTVPAATPVRVRTNTALEVRIGPGTQFAAVGTIARGESIDVAGRDAVGEWVAFRFPPGSSARGWIPVSAVDNLTNLYGLTVAAPTPLPRSIATPIGGSSTGGSLGPVTTVTSNDGVLATAVPGTTATPSATGSPAVAAPPDLAVTGLTMLTDGRVRVTITNRGGDLEGFHVFAVVTDPTTRSESLRSNGAGLRAGASVVLESSTFIVLGPTDVTAIADPSRAVPDANRANNSLSATLGVVPTATPAPQ